ncbi:MAG: hypothetical protein WD871_12210 [Xanthobacteraceae bacterium]
MKKLGLVIAAIAALVLIAGPAMKVSAATPGKGDNLWDAWRADVKKLQDQLSGKGAEKKDAKKK